MNIKRITEAKLELPGDHKKDHPGAAVKWIVGSDKLSLHQNACAPVLLNAAQLRALVNATPEILKDMEVQQ